PSSTRAAGPPAARFAHFFRPRSCTRAWHRDRTSMRRFPHVGTPESLERMASVSSERRRKRTKHRRSVGGLSETHMAKQVLVELLYALEEGGCLKSVGLNQAALTTEQLRAVLREALSVEPDPSAISAMFGSSLARRATPLKP